MIDMKLNFCCKRGESFAKEDCVILNKGPRWVSLDDASTFLLPVSKRFGWVVWTVDSASAPVPMAQIKIMHWMICFIYSSKSSVESFDVVDVFACGHTATAYSPGNPLGRFLNESTR